MSDETRPREDLEPTESLRPAGEPSSSIPDRIGSYQVLGELGSGGMGIVYEAQQQQPKRRVALKVVRGGRFVDDQQVRMFQREANALARLKHPNIGAIYESGRTNDGQHFFAMELVRGETLHDWLKKRPKAVSPEELNHRLELFRKIADAVHYAHQRGVIHRDLKPSNIIVEGSEVKILDFGLARITESDVTATTVTSEVGVIKGTLPYMSPEQAKGNAHEIDVRTDVYALGVILYELLAGTRPYDVIKKSLPEAVRVICEETPKPLRQSWSGVRRLDADIETIVAKALEKNAERRYGTAAALAEDVSRYLASQPILARPPSMSYQLGKFARRNKVLVGGLAAVFLALAAGAIVSTWQAVRATQAEAVAKNEATTAGQVLDFLVGLFEVSDPSEARGNSITAREILDKGAKEIDETLADQPEVRARLMDTMGTVYSKLGLYPQSEPLVEQALETRRRLFGDEHPETLSSVNNLAVLYKRQGRYDESEPLQIEALETRKRVLGDDHPHTLNSVVELAALYWNQGRYDEAERLFLEALESQERLLGDDHGDTLGTMNNLALLYNSQGRYAEAEPLYLKALETRKRLFGADHPDTLGTMNNLARLYKRLGRFPEAESVYFELLEAAKRVLGDDHPNTLIVMNSFGGLYMAQGRYDEARPFILSSVEGHRRVLGDDHPNTLNAMNNLGNLHHGQDRYDEAEAVYRKLLQAQQDRFGEEHISTQRTVHNLAVVYRDTDRFDQSQQFFERVRRFCDAKLQPEHDLSLYNLKEHAKLRRKMGDDAGAASLEARIKAIREKR